MAMEPMTLFARIADPAGVARLLRETARTVEIDGPDDGWRNAVVAFDGKTLTFTHDPAYYTDPNWSVQMDGMRGYFSRFPQTDRKEAALMLTTTFKFSLGLVFDPDCDAEDDERLTILFSVAGLLDGVLFTPSAFRDACGRILYGAAGEDEEDTAAVWPRVIAEINLANATRTAVDTVGLEQDEALRRPNPGRVARRALALTAVTARAILEQGGVNLGLVRRVGIHSPGCGTSWRARKAGIRIYWRGFSFWASTMNSNRTNGTSCNALRAGSIRSSRLIRPGDWKAWAFWLGSRPIRHSATRSARRVSFPLAKPWHA